MSNDDLDSMRPSDAGSESGAVDGARDMPGVALIVGVARGITVIMNNGLITDTVLYTEPNRRCRDWAASALFWSATCSTCRFRYGSRRVWVSACTLARRQGTGGPAVTTE
jgi:hypothetical protein